MKTIVCLGDSITYGFDNRTNSRNYKQVRTPYPQALQNILGQNITVINSGNVGWQAKTTLPHLEDLVYKHQPDLVILMLGINDARGSRYGLPVSRKSYYLKMKELITQITNHEIQVLILSPTLTFNCRVKSFNTVAVQLAQELNLKYIDMHNSIQQQLDEDGLKLQDVLLDHVHLSQDYYLKLAQIVSQEIDL